MNFKGVTESADVRGGGGTYHSRNRAGGRLVAGGAGWLLQTVGCISYKIFHFIVNLLKLGFMTKHKSSW